MAMLYDIPAHIAAQVQSGNAELFGAIIKNVHTGQIIGHVQQTGFLSQALEMGTSGVLNSLSNGISPLNVVTALQNQKISSQLSHMQQSIGLIQNLQVSNLALSGVGLGVSVVGFAVVLKRLKSIQANIDSIDRKLEQVTVERRKDEIDRLFAHIEADVTGVNYLSTQPDPERGAEAYYRGLMRSAREIDALLNRETEFAKNEGFKIEQLDRMWSLVAALRVCQETTIKALFYADLFGTAGRFAEDEAKKLQLHLAKIAPDNLARMIANQEPDWQRCTALRRTAFTQAKALTDGIVESTISMASQSSFARSLADKGTSGRLFLLEAEEEKKHPLIFLPS